MATINEWRTLCDAVKAFPPEAWSSRDRDLDLTIEAATEAWAALSEADRASVLAERDAKRKAARAAESAVTIEVIDES